MWDRHYSGTRVKSSGLETSAGESRQEGEAWLDQLRADIEVVLATTRAMLQQTIREIAKEAGIRVNNDPDSAQPGDLLILDHLFPEPPVSHLGDVVVIGVLGEERGLLQCVRRLGAAHAVVLPTGRDWLYRYMVRSVGVGEHRSGAAIHHPNPKSGSEYRVESGGAERERRSLGHVDPAPREANGRDELDGDALTSQISPIHSESATRGSHGGLCIGVVPCCGGCGATTLTIALGLAAARVGDALIVDADPWGHGLSASLGSDWPQLTGWAAIAPNTQQIDASELRATLPRDPGFWVLGGAASIEGDIPQALPAVTAAAREGFDVTVLDLGRTASGVAAARLCDVVVLMLPTTLAGVMGARRVLDTLVVSQGADRSVRAVLASRDMGGLTPQDIAEHLGHEVALNLGSSRLIAERAAAGELVRGRSGRRLSAWGDRLLAVLS